MFKYPQDFGGPTLLQTPQILYDYLPSRPGRGGFTYIPPTRSTENTEQRRGGHSWGRGNTLGAG